MQKIIIKHIKGARAKQIDMFELPILELVLGRDSHADIKFDPQRDDVVGRNHAKIVFDNGDFKLKDLNSTNGTFVNGKRVQGSVILNVDDVIKLGESGVELSFEIAPRPENSAGATRFEQSTAQQTREQASATRHDSFTSESSGAKSSIGRNTVERLISENTSQTRKKVINIAAGILVVVILSAAGLLYKNRQDQEGLVKALDVVKHDSTQTISELEKKIPTGMTPSQISEQYSGSTVLIEASWKLFKTETGEQLYHVYACLDAIILEKFIKGEFDKKDINNYLNNKNPPYISCKSNKSKSIPVYIMTSYNNSDIVEPILHSKNGFNDEFHEYVAIGSFGRGHKGTGFVINEDGFILTNRHVAAAWETKYNWKNEDLIGLLITCIDSECVNTKRDFLFYYPKFISLVKSWVPSNTKTLGGKPSTGRFIVGRNDYLDAIFANTHVRIPADIVRTSDVADVAMIQIKIPNKVKPVLLANSNDTVQAGNPVTVTGYPAISPNVDVKIKSQDPLNRDGEWRVMPTPTTATGSIAKVVRGNEKILGETTSEYYSEMGDVYQLNVNTIGEGNSGGPVFNDAGRVIGIFTYGCNCEGVANSFAVPIKYGEELMGINTIR